jgi:hypothetical protein
VATDWISLAVPAADQDDIRELIQARQASRGEPISPSPTELFALGISPAGIEAARLRQQPLWGSEAVQHLLADESEHVKRFVRAIYAVDRTPGEFFGTTEVADLTGMTIGEWRHAQRQLRARILEPNYPEAPRWETGAYAGEAAWPLADLSGRHIARKDETHVAITPQQSRVWREVAGIQ